jgi:hypothetical protein
VSDCRPYESAARGGKVVLIDQVGRDDMPAGNKPSAARSSCLSCRARNSRESPMVEKAAKKHSPERSIQLELVEPKQ